MHQEQVPRKQGLKLGVQHDPFGGTVHQEQVPRKQGLKQCIGISIQTGKKHQEQVPRKQGLKPNMFLGILLYIHPSRASSTKTRIETTISCTNQLYNTIIKSKFHENKD